jgi:hypothetical protein
MTIRQVVRRKVTRALTVAVVFLVSLVAIYQFARDAEWAWVSIPLMLGVMAPLLYVVWFVDCPKCHAIFGQRYVFNVAFNLPSFRNNRVCPNCEADLDAPCDPRGKPV